MHSARLCTTGLHKARLQKLTLHRSRYWNTDAACAPFVTDGKHRDLERHHVLADRHLNASSPQSASEHASSSPLCCRRNQHLALGFPNEVSPNSLDAFHVAHRWLCHRTAHLHWRELEIWSILRQVTDSCHECSVPCDVTICECLAVWVTVFRHLRSVPVVTVVRVVPLVPSLSLPLSTSALSPCLHPFFPRHMVSQSDLLVPTSGLPISP